MKVKLLFCFLCMTALVHAQSFSPEFQTAYDKYLKAAANTSGSEYADSTLQKQLNQSKARLSCVKKATTVLEVLACYEASGGYGYYASDAPISIHGKELAASMWLSNHRADSLLGVNSIYREALKKLSPEIVITIGVDSADGMPIVYSHLRKNLDKYDNTTLALYALSIGETVDEAFSSAELKVVCKRFRDSKNQYLITTANYLDETPTSETTDDGDDDDDE